MHRFGVDSSSLDLHVKTGEDFLETARAFAVEAACQGAPLNQVIARIEDACFPSEPSFALMKTVTLAWSDSTFSLAAHASCVDPLTDLATLGHVRAALEGLYRRCALDEVRINDEYTLLVVDVNHPYRNQLDCALAAIDVGNALRTLFVRDEIIFSFTGRRFGVLARRAFVNDDALAVLAVLLRKAAGIPTPTMRVEDLPLTMDEIPDFIHTLSL